MISTTQLTPFRYESPTVTLDVMAQTAAVSQWSDRPVVQIRRYELRIHSLSGESPVVEIRGDRVTFLLLAQAIQDYIQAQLNGPTLGASDRSSQPPYLEPQGLTRHVLHLGSLRTQAGDRVVTLGAVQLADLGSIFDQLADQVRPLPVSITPRRRRRLWQQWGAAAAGIVAAVGLTTVLWPTYQPQRNSETALEAPTEESAPLAEPELELSERSPADTDASGDSLAEGDTTANQDAFADATEADPPKTDIATAPDPANPKQPIPKPSPQTSDLPLAEAPTPAPPSPAPPASAPVPPADPQIPPPSSARTAAESAPETVADSTSEAASAESDIAGAASIAIESAPEALSLPDDQAAAVPPPSTLTELIARIRDRWRPPDGFTQTLTYTLTFAANGTLLTVEPADDLAAQYLDRTGIPAPGSERLLATDESQIIQLRLKPNGEVEHEAMMPQ